MTAILDQPRVVDVEEEWSALADELLPLMSPNDVAKVLGTPPGTLGSQRSLGTGPWYVKVGKSIYYPKECVLEWHYRQSGSRRHADPVFTALKKALKPRNRPIELKRLCGISADVLAKWRADPDHPLHPIKDGNHWEYSKERVISFFAANLHKCTGEYATTRNEPTA